MKNKPEVGQIIYSLNVGNVARWREQKLTPCTVSKVGRKYFYLVDERGRELINNFHIDTWRENTNYSPNHLLYETEQEYYDVKAKRELVRKIKDEFGTFSRPEDKYSLETLTEVWELLEGGQ